MSPKIRPSQATSLLPEGARMNLLNRWNRWYDGFPELWKFPLVIGVLVMIGGINMALTIAAGFPFGLLVLIALLALAALRLPYIWGSTPAPGVYLQQARDQAAAGAHSDWAHHWNLWYDDLPELWRFQFVLGALVLLGAINMALTIAFAFPFGLLVLVGVAALIVVRVPYTFGWGGPATTTYQPLSFERSSGSVIAAQAAPAHEPAQYPDDPAPPPLAETWAAPDVPPPSGPPRDDRLAD